MHRLTSLVVTFTLFSWTAKSDGLNAVELQNLLRSAPNTGVAGQFLQNVNLSQTMVLAATATSAQTLSSKLAEHVSVADFGAVGGATTSYLAVGAGVGDTNVVLTGSAPVTVGQIVDGPGVQAGTVVSSKNYQTKSGAGSATTTVIGLSIPLQGSSALGQRFDFAIQDDYPAFLRAQASGAKYIEVPAGSTREYYLSSYAGNVPGITWKLNGAFFAQNGGLVEGVNQSMTQDLNSESLLNNMVAPSGEDTLLVTAANQPSSSSASYQKNVVHVQLNQGDPSSYNFLGDAQTIVRDIVGYSVQGHCPSNNKKCSMFGSEALMTMDPTSEGAMTGYEISIANLSGNSTTEMGSWNNKSALTLIGNGSTMGTAMWVNGNAWQTGIDLSTSIIGKAWTIRTEGPRGATGLATTHTDYAYMDHNGSFFAQTAHIGGGPTTGDLDPVGGVTVPNEAAGRIIIGNATLASSSQPSLEFHAGTGASADTYATRFMQTSAGLQLQISGGSPSAIFHPDESTEFDGSIAQTRAVSLVAGVTPIVLAAHFNTVSSCPPGGGVVLSAAIPVGSDLYVLNRCGASFSIVASAGFAIESNPVGTGVTIAASMTQHYYLESATQWRQLQ